MVRLPRVVAISAVGVALVAAGAAAWAVLLQPAAGAPSVARPGAPAPQIALDVVGGGTSNLAGDRGKVVLVNFWGYLVRAMQIRMPALQRLADDLRDSSFRLYSVDLQEDAQQVEAFQRQYGLNLYAVLDDNGDVTRAYGVRALPATFLIDQHGLLREQRLGPILAGDAAITWSEAWLATQVRTLLASG